MIGKEKSEEQQTDTGREDHPLPRQPILFTASGDALYDSAAAEEGDEKKRNGFKKFWKWFRKDWVATATLFVLIVYTVFTGIQSCTFKTSVRDNANQFNQTLCQMKAQTRAQENQTTLMRQQLVGTEGAEIGLNDPSWYLGDRRLHTLVFGVQNTGGVTGTVIKFVSTIQRKTLPDQKPIGQAVLFEFFNQEVPKTNHSYNRNIWLPWSLPRLEDLNLWPGKEMITVEGQYTYTDGFGDIISHKFCYVWLPPLQFDAVSTTGPTTNFVIGDWSNDDEYCPLQAMEDRFFGRGRKTNLRQPYPY